MALSTWAACRQVGGIEQREAHADACQQCGAAACAEQLSACEASGPCAARRACLLSCAPGDTACASRCRIDCATPQYEEISALVACESEHCSAQCGSSCGDVPVVAPASAADTCRDCTETRCCEMADSCKSAEACVGIAECVRSHPTPDEAQACQAVGGETASATYASLESCQGLYCATECAVGSYWACLSHVSWPRAEQARIRMVLRTVDNIGMVPIAGLSVEACALADPDCLDPLSSGTTGDDGRVTLEVDTVSMSGLVGFTGYALVKDPTSVRLPTLVFANPPIRRDGTEHEVVAIGDEKLTAAVAKQAGVTLVAGRGHVVLGLRDCSNRSAAGVALTATPRDESTAVRHAQGFVVPDTATASDRYGTGFVLNAMPGPLAIQGQLQATGDAVGTVNVLVRSGHITEVVLSPAP